LWKADSTSFGAGGTIRDPNQKRVSCLNKSASGNRLGRNDPHPPTIDDKDLTGVLRVGLSELRDHVAYEDFVPFLQLREFPAQTLNLSPIAAGQFRPVKV
jgi:hypothetical protein